MIFITPDSQIFYPEFIFNKKSYLHTFSGFARVLCNYIVIPTCDILLFMLSIPLFQSAILQIAKPQDQKPKGRIV